MTRRARAFITVGALGFGVQMAALFVVLHWWRWPYPVSAALAVEAAVLHNFAWHERWTWRDRGRASSGRAARLLRFHLGTGAASIAGNVLVTVLLVELAAMPAVAANAAAVAVMSVANFLVADRWVFRRATAVAVAIVALSAAPAWAAGPGAATLDAWTQHVATVEQSLWQDERDRLPSAPAGRTIAVTGGSIHEWRGSVLVPGVRVGDLVQALQVPGLPPPAPDIVDARVLGRHGDALHVYLKLTRTALVTVTYDTEHDVTFRWLSPTMATSRSASTSITETGGSDRGFLWRLNSYWRYRQTGDDVLVELLSVSLSRDVPGLLRPVAAPLVTRIGRESMAATLDAVARFGTSVGGCGSRSADATAPHRC